MRKIIYIAISTILFFNSSCSDDKFANSAATRIQAELENSKKVLCEAENGWWMQYYATPESPGYSMLMKFESSELVTIAGRNELTGHSYLESKSLYNLVADYGPVLSFDTYNDILHAFSDPSYPQGSGLMGDYEFIIYHRTETAFEMAGKKRNTRILMEKLPVDISWETYFDQLDEMKNILFGQNPPELTLSLGDNRYVFSEGKSGIFTISGTDIPADNLLQVPLITTKTGINLYRPIELAGHTFQKFKLNEESSALISENNADVKLNGISNLTEYFHAEASKITTTWYIDRNNSSADIQELCNLIEESLKTRYGNIVSDIYLAINRVTENQIGFIVHFVLRDTNIYDAKYSCNWTRLSDTEANLVYNGDSDANGQALYTQIKGISEFTALLAEQRSYILSTTTPINPIKIKLTQKDNPSTRIMLSLDKPLN